MSNLKERSGGVDAVGVVLIVFVILKLCNVVDWSWWWVLSPLWICLALATVLFIVFKTIEKLF